jgi:hypothetical protein
MRLKLLADEDNGNLVPVMVGGNAAIGNSLAPETRLVVSLQRGPTSTS